MMPLQDQEDLGEEDEEGIDFANMKDLVSLSAWDSGLIRGFGL